MRALVMVEVYQLGGFANATNRCLLNSLTITDQSNDTAIVIRVHLTIQQINTWNPHSFNNGVDLGLIPAFGEIWNAFDKSIRHERRIMTGACLPQLAAMAMSGERTQVVF